MGDTPAYAAAGPVVSVDGTREGELARDLVRLDIEESTAGLRTMRAHLLATSAMRQSSNDVVEYVDGKVLDFGKKIEVALGPDGNQKVVFTGLISAIEASFTEADAPTVVVYAEDALMKLRMTQRSATYVKVSDADLVRTIASRHNLEARPDADGPTYDVVQQVNQSDLAFLRERARRIRAELWVDESALHLTTRDRRPGTTVTLVRGGDLIRIAARADLSEQCTSVHVSGYDASSRAAIDAEGPGSTVEAEISGGRTGPQTLQRAFGSLPGRRIRDVPVVEADAQAVARAEMLARSRRFVQVQGVTNGTPQMVVGSKLTLSRCGRPFDGSGYYVTFVHQTFDLRRGLRTEFAAERATVNAA